ncbi:MAG: heme ABC exporter ATP-binding protein CcmA [Candidatus Eiseniibacteriota bacterium]
MTIAGSTVVRVRELHKQFGALRAVDGVSFEIQRGEIFGILGPNGSGKTTAIRMMCGLMTPNAGEIEVAGVDVCAQPDRVKSRIGYMSQTFGLYSDLTVLENLRFYAGVYQLGAKWRERTEWALATMRLAERRGDLAGTLSGGSKQRLALGCAVMHEPPVLFLDEPTAGVDPAARRLFWNLIRALAAGGTAIIVTTHYMDEAERFDRLAFLSSGKRIALGTPAEVRAGFGAGASLEDIFVRLQEQGT